VSRRLAFPLISRRRLVGSPFGTQRSSRRGRGDETAGTRPYLPGDPTSTIEWAASARLSAARGADEFIVRELFAEEAPVVAIVLDRRPSMGLYAPPSPWLDKRLTTETAVGAIVASADEARAVVGLFDGAPRSARLLQPARGRSRVVRAQIERAPLDAPPSALDDAVASLVRRRRALPAGSFVFVLSDFLGEFSGASRAALHGLRGDVVPVVIQDPTWERSFPEVPDVLLPTVDVATDRPCPVRLTRGETRARRQHHEARIAELVVRFRRAGMDPVELDDPDPERVHRAFLAWSARRARMLRRAR
jgi:uncharacterized protein (DUF58 family)